MKFSPIVLIIAIFGLFAAAPVVHADELDMREVVSANDVKPNLPQPYIVKKGDTLWDIAKLYDGVSVEQIKVLNNIQNSKRLKPGQKIKVAEKS